MKVPYRFRINRNNQSIIKENSLDNKEISRLIELGYQLEKKNINDKSVMNDLVDSQNLFFEDIKKMLEDLNE